MAMRFFLIALLFALSLLHTLKAQQVISGKVVDESGNGLPYANLYWKTSKLGTSSNIDGDFSMQIPKDGGVLVVRYIGYNYWEDSIKPDSDQELVIQLEPNKVEVSEVIVTGEEDPAYRIIREAIAKRKFHLQQVQSFSCNTYIKGTIRLNEIPEKPPAFFPKALMPDTNDLGLIFLTESRSEYHFQRPDKKKEEMIASRIAGFSSGYSWNRASEMEINLYKNAVYNQYYSERNIISPIGDNAFFFYKYRLAGLIYEEGKTIYQIAVIPKRKSDPVFSGKVYIVDGTWNLHSFELGLKRENGLLFADSLYLGRNYFPVNDSLWMPLSNHAKAGYNIFGFDVTEQYMAYYEAYDINKEFEKGFFGGAVFKVEVIARDRDSTYWDTTRAAVLTEEESQKYHVQDSLELLRQSPAYMDSLDRILNKPNVIELLATGYTYGKRYHRKFLSFSPLIEMFNYNTVEGFNIALRARFSKWSEEYRTGFSTLGELKYGVGNQQFNAKGFIGFRLSRRRFESIGFGGGRFSMQYNNQDPIGPFINTMHTLFIGQNFMKLYDARYGTVKYQGELFNGFFLHADFTYADRRPLVNVTDYSFRKPEKLDMTSNDPQNPDSEVPAFEQHQAAYLRLKATFRPGQKYELYPHKKELLGSKWPVFSLEYKKGLEIFGSKVNYDFMEFGIGDKVRLGLVGESEYDVFAGGFINNISMEFMDYKHFDGNQAYLLPVMGVSSGFGEADRSPNRLFEALPYYSNSTNRYFIEAHYMHHFKGFLMNKIPGIRKLELQVLAGVNYLNTPESGNYFELITGIENIFRVLRLDLATFWIDGQGASVAFRMGVDLDLR